MKYKYERVTGQQLVDRSKQKIESIKNQLMENPTDKDLLDSLDCETRIYRAHVMYVSLGGDK